MPWRRGRLSAGRGAVGRGVAWGGGCRGAEGAEGQFGAGCSGAWGGGRREAGLLSI